MDREREIMVEERAFFVLFLFALFVHGYAEGRREAIIGKGVCGRLGYGEGSNVFIELRVCSASNHSLMSQKRRSPSDLYCRKIRAACTVILQEYRQWLCFEKEKDQGR